MEYEQTNPSFNFNTMVKKLVVKPQKLHFIVFLQAPRCDYLPCRYIAETARNLISFCYQEILFPDRL